MRDDNAPSRFSLRNMMGSAEKPAMVEQSVFEKQPQAEQDQMLEPTMVNETKSSDQEVEVSLDTKLVSYIARECDFDKDPSPLYGYIQKRDWDGTCRRAEEAPIEAMTWVSRKENDGRLRWRLLPLHSAVIFKAPEKVVEALLCAYPKGAQCKDDQGMLPIHLAFRHGNSEDVVNLLLLAYPQSIDVKDRKGRIPLELAQASASPNRDAFVRALERGPSYYAVAAAATERAAVTAEQRAIFDAKLIELKNTHKHEMAALNREHEAAKMDLAEQVQHLEEELARTQETSQVLVDHVSSLEAQLASRSDTERFLATKIATLDSSLKETSMIKENVETELKADVERLTRENEELKSQLEFVQTEETEGKSKLNETECRLSELVEVYEKKNHKQAETIQLLEADLINARATTGNLESQLKNKIIVEQTLASQVSTLASRLAESAADTSNATSVYAQRVQNLDAERLQLRTTVKDLTSKLANVAKCLDAMTMEQECIVKSAADHEKAMVEAAQLHSEILADARRQQELYEATQHGRDQICEILKLQADSVASTRENREKLMEKVVTMDAQMKSSHKDREDLVCSVVRQRLEMRDLIKNALSVVPKDITDEDEIIDEVVKTTMKTIAKKAESEAKDASDLPVDEKEEAVDKKEEISNPSEEALNQEHAAATAAVKEEPMVDNTVEEPSVVSLIAKKIAATSSPKVAELKTAPAAQEANEEPSAVSLIAKESAADAASPVAVEGKPAEPKKKEHIPTGADSKAQQEETESEQSVTSKGTVGTEELSAEEEPIEEVRVQPAAPRKAEDRVLASRSLSM